MSKPRVLILRAPGTNCDQETEYAFRQSGADGEIVHVNRLLEKPDLVDEYQILCLPGGFSYGDDIAAGRILANQIEHHLEDAIRRFRDQQKLILGICNGFQVLLKSGLLFEETAPKVAPATLTWNDSRKFEDRWVRLRADGDQCVFLRGLEEIYLPVAHAEGKFVAADDAPFDHWSQGGQLALRYASQTSDEGEPAYPCNPNGSQGSVAGVCDSTGRVFGLMPHPERYIDRTQHPRWTRMKTKNDAAGDGLKIFENAVSYFAA